MGKIALEEHYATAEALDRTAGQFPSPFAQAYWPSLSAKLRDTVGQRLDAMDASGIDLSVLSLSAPGAQDVADPAAAQTFARTSNDELADVVGRHPDRFRAFAVLPMQDPDLAAEEARRAVRDLGMVGFLINGFSRRRDDVTYYDEPSYRDFWRTVADLGAPFYLHPRLSEPQVADALYRGHPWLQQSSWAFSVQTATHALRLIVSGLFDDVPALNVILGHLGEGLTFHAWRIEHRMRAEWGPVQPALEKSVEQYLRANFHVTTSGFRDERSLRNVLDSLGPDRVLFATDYPMEEMESSARWLDELALDADVRDRITHRNAHDLFRPRP